MGKITEKKKWAIFFEILQRKPVILAFMSLILALSLICSHYDAQTILFDMLRVLLK